jgi:3-oxoadipate CoA-transferase beta subunit
VTILAGGSYLSHADSFALIRGGYIDVSIMGAYQVSVTGDLANWSAGVGTPAVGGAMDLASGARSVWVLMRHDDPDRGPRLLDRCTLPLTAAGKVSRIYTDLGIFVIGERSFVAVGLATDIEQVRKRTGAHVEVAADCVPLPRATAAPLAPLARK